MAVSAKFLEFVVEQLAPLGPVADKRFFSGRGLYLDGQIFGFIIDDVLYFKVDDLTRPTFEAEGSTPFQYATKTGMQTITSYWQAPERLFDDADAMTEFARTAVATGRRAIIKKSKPRRRRT